MLGVQTQFWLYSLELAKFCCLYKKLKSKKPNSRRSPSLLLESLKEKGEENGLVLDVNLRYFPHSKMLSSLLSSPSMLIETLSQQIAHSAQELVSLILLDYEDFESKDCHVFVYVVPVKHMLNIYPLKWIWIVLTSLEFSSWY